MSKIPESVSTLMRIGISEDDARALRRASMTLHRWHEGECGDGNEHASWCIERDETSGKPYRVTHSNSGRTWRTPIPDREKGALGSIKRILAGYAELGLYYYIQGDPRGCALYILRSGDVPDGKDIECYYSRGFAVY